MTQPTDRPRDQPLRPYLLTMNSRAVLETSRVTLVVQTKSQKHLMFPPQQTCDAISNWQSNRPMRSVGLIAYGRLVLIYSVELTITR